MYPLAVRGEPVVQNAIRRRGLEQLHIQPWRDLDLGTQPGELCRGTADGQLAHPTRDILVDIPRSPPHGLAQVADTTLEVGNNRGDLVNPGTSRLAGRRYRSSLRLRFCHGMASVSVIPARRWFTASRDI